MREPFRKRSINIDRNAQNAKIEHLLGTWLKEWVIPHAIDAQIDIEYEERDKAKYNTKLNERKAKQIAQFNKVLEECNTDYISNCCKIFVNGSWIGITNDPIHLNETLKSYAKRMSILINDVNPVIRGVSFGGILVQEISKHIKVKKLIIISSVKSKVELSLSMKFAKKTGTLIVSSKGFFAIKSVLNPSFSACARASSVVPVLEQFSLNFIKFLSFEKSSAIG